MAKKRPQQRQPKQPSKRAQREAAAAKATFEDDESISSASEDDELEQPPVTRTLLALALGTTASCHLGLVSPAWLYFDLRLIVAERQLWRLATCFTYFGPLGMSLALRLLDLRSKGLRGRFFVASSRPGLQALVQQLAARGYCDIALAAVPEALPRDAGTRGRELYTWPQLYPHGREEGAGAALQAVRASGEPADEQGAR